MIEVVIPTFSLICLLGVTIYVAVDAINVLTIPRDREHDIDVVYLYGFAVANAVIDILSSYIFLRKGDIKEVFYNIDAVNAQGQEKPLSSIKDIPIGKTTNLNMMSAFTHLSGDSLRTASVLVGAMVSTFAGIPSQICDAWAALAVTISIIFIIVPVAYEIVKACLKYI
jgi:Co/Zn/Cd efflux system component